MNENEKEVLWKEVPTAATENQKRIDETAQILYELFCQYRLKKSDHKELKSDPSPSFRWGQDDRT